MGLSYYIQSAEFSDIHILSSCDSFTSTPNIIDFVRMACTIEPPPEVLCRHPSCERIPLLWIYCLSHWIALMGLTLLGSCQGKKCSRAGHKYIGDNREDLWILFNFLTVQYLVLFNSNFLFCNLATTHPNLAPFLGIEPRRCWNLAIFTPTGEEFFELFHPDWALKIGIFIARFHASIQGYL